MITPNYTEELLEDIAANLQVQPGRYEAAERSYKSVGKWLHRQESTVRQAYPKVYTQGSFRLGTAIRPVSEEEDYDIDLVCELSLSKSQLTQARLKKLLGKELEDYVKAHNMKAPEEGRRCWTLEYADEAQFHIDILPALPDAAHLRLFLEQAGYSSEWTDTAIAITDRDDPNFLRITEDWPNSNPKGYANWFHSKMRKTFEARRHAMALEVQSSIEDIPEYKVHTPLQSAIQILKRHRDEMFTYRTDEKPISIIVTTLAAHAYQEESTISGALYNILSRMDEYIEERNGVTWIANPTNHSENFADRWRELPERKKAFYEWLSQARADFNAAKEASNRDMATTALEPRLGGKLLKAANTCSPLNRFVRGTRRFGKILNPRHKKSPPWTRFDLGEVRIEHGIIKRNGFRPEQFRSDAPPLSKHRSLKFQAYTNVSKPFQVYWQVVNTGQEAEEADGLRGGFDKGIVTEGKLTKNESTLYSGTHSIECFIVRNGYLAARSSQFIVNIR